MTKGNHYTKNNECSIETVLSMQAGGSLGAYECGSFKSLVKHNIWFDIIAGNSIGSVNAAIIVDAIKKAQHNNNYEHTKDDNNSKLLKEAAKKLEHFWLDSADNITDITAEQICSCIGYPFYGLKCPKVDDRYIWDGSLINSTPLTAVRRKAP